MCVTGKGLMNRAHAYKASVDQNTAKGVEADDGVTMGLFSYPVLMAADILMFNAHKVPVGRDQVQHIEMTRDIAQRFNHLYGREFFVLPDVVIEEEVATLPGLDGRKMSKSYNNTIPLFEGGARALRAAVSRIVTDSRQPGEAKDADSAHLFTIYRAFASQAESAQLRAQLADGMGWRDAKEALIQRLEQDIAPMRDRYDALISNPGRIEEILQAGAQKARKLAQPAIEALREAVGLRNLTSGPVQAAAGAKKAAKGARFVSFRDDDGSFRFRLLGADGNELLVSGSHADPKAAGALTKRLQQPGVAVVTLDGLAVVASLDGAEVARGAPAADAAAADAQAVQVQDALASLAQ